ncbi:MAG TPA: capsular biosynthesis protein [Noviherbaspirillum sp.]|uniref:capsular biosynthesis protein n=1 Tax=Noviherbaspirillum sp. TaxID=1926288 RepID=UPI002D389650|nr:capsular biosynthesis protein [Noviherbaspirillum sp.]HYD95997.1 capsular biosynthesis protein [Noviherbaspirillum sp.]
MIRKQLCIVMDVDGTLCPVKQENERYSELEPIAAIVDKLKWYESQGFYIILYSSRNMNTHDGNVGKIVATTGKQMMEWLDRHRIPYDELHLGKPWAGRGGFYVDDKTIRPDEFLRLSYEEIQSLIGADVPGP